MRVVLYEFYGKYSSMSLSARTRLKYGLVRTFKRIPQELTDVLALAEELDRELRKVLTSETLNEDLGRCLDLAGRLMDAVRTLKDRFSNIACPEAVKSLLQALERDVAEIARDLENTVKNIQSAYKTMSEIEIATRQLAPILKKWGKAFNLVKKLEKEIGKVVQYMPTQTETGEQSLLRAPARRLAY